MDEQKYMINDSPASARDIIKEASLCDDDFADSGFKSTSEAAQILRKYGYLVEENPDYVKG